MVFSSPLFLFGFLPIVLLLYFVSPRIAKNTTLLIASLFFYTWGEGVYALLMILSILVNYFLGRIIGQVKQIEKLLPPCSAATDFPNLEKTYLLLAYQKKFFLTIGVTFNLLLLGTFKYANFITNNINELLSLFHFSPFNLEPVHLPIGISFFTFHVLSYLIDIYRGVTPAQTSICNFGLYISLFPQLIAGPIIRYRDVADQFTTRTHSLELIAKGIQRFIYGLAKKVLIANPLGEVADGIFGLPISELTPELAWLGLFCYTLQIYFDFSGYSDMAIGLGKICGFHFLENFNYPYIAQSIQEFWRRWHISLSNWFRDYLYIPLGGNRVAPWRVYLNLLTVFFLCGLWHGASWNFVIWGLLHGFFLVLERIGASKVLAYLWQPLRHLYTLTVVLLGWVFFRTATLEQAYTYLSTLLGLHEATRTIYTPGMYLNTEVWLALITGIILSVPFYRVMETTSRRVILSETFYTILTSGLLFTCTLKIAAGTYNPFIYFRF